jgi:nicotinamidase-related amidase
VGHCEVILFKPRWGAFFRTSLEEHLRALSIDTVVFVGCNFPNCPRTSIYEASERDFRVVAVEDAISGLYEQGRRELNAIGVILRNAAEVAESMASPGRARP